MTKTQQRIFDAWTDGLEMFRFSGPVKQYAGLRTRDGVKVEYCQPATVDAMERIGVIRRSNRDPWLALYEKA